MDGFRTVDYVLSNRPDDFSIRGTTVIEKIAHEFHMQEASFGHYHFSYHGFLLPHSGVCYIKVLLYLHVQS